MAKERDWRKIQVVGMGPGHPNFLPPVARQTIQEAEAVAGGPRALELLHTLRPAPMVTFTIDRRLPELIAFLKEHQDKRRAVLVSGDPGFYSVLSFLLRFFPGQLEVIPGISSLQLAFAEAVTPWQDAFSMSLHGRPAADLLPAIREQAKVAILTDANFSPARLGDLLEKAGLEREVWLGQTLSTPKERVFRGSVPDLRSLTGDWSNAILILSDSARGGGNQLERPKPGTGPAKAGQFEGERPKEDNPAAGEEGVRPAAGGEGGRWPFATPGLPDACFQRGAVPMTKEEVRALVLAKLRLKRDSLVYDVGAGTGSVAVEAALIANRGRVYAVEREAEAVTLIRQNRVAFQLSNLEVVEGEAPEVLEGLPLADRVFVGGSGGRLADLLTFLGKRGFAGRLVLTIISLETLYEVLGFLQSKRLQGEVVLLQVSKADLAGKHHLLRAGNPVFVLTSDWGTAPGRKEGEPLC
ncbi:MAG: precorrin-6y C5,15-methyltransferase (decarboxylating) subunit CbiE [Firmicutes bacterium]|nr:precorrin-6y C5,15-methyltransferase (decarboxylating) subunit CbiE [Bacillota bacterium]